MKVYFSIGNQPDNLGDVILNRSLIETFEKRGDVFVDDFYLDDGYLDGFGVSRDRLMSERKDLPDPRTNTGKLRWVFGAQTFQCFSRYPGHYFPRKGFKWLLHDLKMAVFYTLLKMRGIKVILVGVTIDTTHLKGLKGLLWRWQASQHELFSVRDKTIYEDLKKLGFSTVKHVPDLFLLSTRDEEPVLEKDLEERTKRVVICLRPDIPEVAVPGATSDLTRARVAEILERLDPEIEVVFSFQVDRDGEYVKSLYEAHKNRPNTRFESECQTVESAFELYRESSVILSNRLHCLLYGLTVGAAPVALTDWEQHTKIRYAWKDFEISDYRFDLNGSVDAGMQTISSILSDEWTHRQALRKRALEIKQSVLDALEGALLGL